ncbi:MAG: hypothetical protein ABR551_07070 [Gemmatimonadales bacterium]
MRHSRLTTLAAPILLGSCLLGSEPSDIPDADLRMLFIGNSLTYTNDMPRMVQHLANAAARSFAYGVAAAPNYSLEDHWADGITSTIAAQRADIVVMQQGPSSVPANQQHLAFWAGQLEPSIRAAGGIPALYMVWPEVSRLSAFDAVRDAYFYAAEAVEGLFLPAGEAWRAAWARDPGLTTYNPDGFHPSVIGSMAAALTIFTVAFEAEDLLASCPFPEYPGVSTVVMQLLCVSVLDALNAPHPGDGKPRTAPTPRR